MIQYDHSNIDYSLTGYRYIDQDIREFLARKDLHTIVFEEHSSVSGFCVFSPNGKLILYVKPESRGRGIGTKLYNEALMKLQSSDIGMFEAVVLEDSTFFSRRGYSLWYKEHIMLYNGCFDTNPFHTVIPYQGRFFEQYIESIRESFYDMRKKYDFIPYYCRSFDDQERLALENDKENIYIILKEDALCASAAVHIDSTDMIGPVFVSPAFRGKGYGKEITVYAVREAFKRGATAVTLEVNAANTVAVNMYEGIGFTTVGTMSSYRLMLH